MMSEWAMKNYQDLVGENCLRDESGMEAKYSYTDIQGKRWPIGVCVILAQKTVSTWNEGTGEFWRED